VLSAAGSVLVAGSASPSMPTQHVRVIRPFFHAGKAVPAGDIIEVPLYVAAEAISCGKAVAADPPPPPVEIPAVESEPARKTRGKKHAWNER